MSDLDIVFTAADDVRDEIIEALHYHRASLQRMPTHWVDRRAKIHARINDLLDELEDIGF